MAGYAMSKGKKTVPPRVRGKKWIRAQLPQGCQPWTIGRPADAADELQQQALQDALQCAGLHGKWQWPRRQVFFVADPHADADAFVDSLALSGGIRKTGPEAEHFTLTKEGKQALFIIGGDCLDKGPSNLRLLAVVKRLMDKTRRVRILAGNHDLRLLMGLRCLQLPPDPRTDHFFIRMSPKVVPLLKEVYDYYLLGSEALSNTPDKAKCRSRLYPAADWFEEFPLHAQWVMPQQGIDKETGKLRQKMQRFESVCANAGLTLRMAYAATIKCQQLFMHPDGEFHWFFNRIQLAYKTGSLLFIHAGVDDRVSAMIEQKGVAHINRQYRHQVKNDLFEFYYGPIANTIRTKYRPVDMPLTGSGVKKLHRHGIKAIVHGHRNRLNGQRLMLRQGLLHFECDTTMDSQTRKKQGLSAHGAGVTIIRPQGQILGVSSDYPSVKIFAPTKNQTAR
jgi:hypothetical protein